ncbi:hypothetical protein PENTCL1PPCAC_19755 [Pristionchus entomophagus]|uniref:N-acetyltransferase domain-containing protein n=1 Tax=Pristionchus entomophagus TaxID=358040 RepID=A0AAV5TSW5_9BILA|nr:hypothetical protein PENTCL1PPCAC_19755 [Pristionchus entomophagus]
MSVPPHTIVDEGTDHLWEQLANIVRKMGWTSHDNTVLSMLPSLASIRCVFSQKNEDGSFLGGIVWSENNDEVAWIGMYVCVPEVRGCGIGGRIWSRMMERIRATGKTFGLRALPPMAAKYSARDIPLEISRMRCNIMSCAELREICDKLETTSSTILLKSSLSGTHLHELLAFDKQMTGRDRSAVLSAFLASPSFECAVLLDDAGGISGWAGITSTGLEESQLFKLAPVYASSLSEVAALIKPLLPFCESFYADARIIIHILTGTVGDRELEPLLSKVDTLQGPNIISYPFSILHWESTRTDELFFFSFRQELRSSSVFMIQSTSRTTYE